MLEILLVSYSLIVGASVIHFANNPIPEPTPTSTPSVEKQEKCGSVCKKP